MVMWHLWYHPKRMITVLEFDGDRFCIFFGGFLYTPTTSHKRLQDFRNYERVWAIWSTLLTPCSPDSWVLLHHRFFNTHELKSAKLDAAFCQSFDIFLHILIACSYQEFWRLFAGFLLETPGFLPIFGPKRPVESTWTCHRCQRHRANPMLVALAVAHLAAENWATRSPVISSIWPSSIIHEQKGINGISWQYQSSTFWEILLVGPPILSFGTWFWANQPFVDGFHRVDPSHLLKHGASHDMMTVMHRQNGDTELVRWRDVQACPSYFWSNIINAPRSIRNFSLKLSSDFEKQPQVKPHNWSSIATAMTIAVGAPPPLLSAEELENREREAVDAYCPLALHMAHGILC